METGTLRFLLDTHALIWLLAGSRKLGRRARAVLEAAPPGSVAIAAITLLEAAMLIERGAITVEPDGAAFLREVEERLVVVPETGEIAWEAVNLELLQKDPFDRVIVATARLLRLQLVTRDREITESALIPVCW